MIADLQKALYTALTGDAALVALCPTITDHGPREDDASGIFPYIAMGEIVAAEHDTDTDNGFDATLRIHTWSNGRGSLECRTIQDAIYAVLQKQDLDLAGWDWINLYREQSSVILSSRGAYHGICEYRAIFNERSQ